VALLKQFGDLKQATLQNSLSGLISTAFPTSELNSFNTLSYNANYAPLTIQWNMLMYLYKTHGVLQAAIDMPVQDAFRGGLDFKSTELDGDDVADVEDYLENNGVYNVWRWTEIWARLFGGAAIITNVEGEDPAQPLDLKRIKGKKIQFYAANRWELTESSGRYADYYNFYGTRLHHTRVMTIAGKEAPYTIKWILQGWGMSDLERMIQPLNLYLLTNNIVYDLLKEAKVDVLQFEGFASQLITDKGTEIALRRIEAANRGKNAGNAIVLDTKDKFDQKQLTFSGLADIWKENRIGLSSSFRIPLSKLFGTTFGGGLANSGQDDLENYNASVESDVREHAKPMIRETLNIVQCSMYGAPLDLSFKFKSLRVLDSVQEEGIRTSQHARWNQDYKDGMITAQEYMQLQESHGLMPISTEVGKGADPERPLDADNDIEDHGEPGNEDDPKKKKEEERD
jgi:phage-related protein (TIGR01555 family)